MVINFEMVWLPRSLCVSRLSLLEMHSGGGVASDLMLSCLTGCLRCKCDLILFLIGQALLSSAKAGSSPCSIGTKPSAVPNALMHNELNNRQAKMSACPEWYNLGIHIWLVPNLSSQQPSSADKKIK